MNAEPDNLTALQGCLLGTAVGDALGLPAEGMSAARIGRRWRGQWRMRIVFGRGMFSDDTEHTFAVAQALAEQSSDAAQFQRVLAAKLRWWFLALPAGIGMATAKACLKLWLGCPTAKSGVYSAGNAPAMRSALIGVYFRGDEDKRRTFVCASTRLTHSDPKAESAAQAVAAAAACAANGSDRDAFLRTLPTFSADPAWLKAMELLREHLCAGSSTREYARSLGLERGVSGYAFHTVPVALYGWLRHPGDFAAALTSVLDCGGDTDTTGAITGGIAGAAPGAEAIPREWRERLYDLPLSPAKLTAAAASLAEGRKVPALFWPARPVRNFIFLLIVLAHGFRRLLPPF
jgi:ADP-ribosyl-[dinitrogen reductase] hydrolase